MGILQCCRAVAATSCSPGWLPFARAEPARLRFHFCRILKPHFKPCRIPVGSKELLVLKV